MPVQGPSPEGLSTSALVLAVSARLRLRPAFVSFQVLEVMASASAVAVSAAALPVALMQLWQVS